ncbi:MAG: UbiD family decarboxylase [Deltaproteobacteria bacterium]|nr:UbiD family decarboxylase [Deltaproteobacteria bacterium]
MMQHDLRWFLELLDARGELVRVKEEVAPHLEVAAICRDLAYQQGPAVLFEHVQGCGMPVVANLFSKRQRLADALGITEAELREHWLRAFAQPIEPELVSGGPCQEVVESRVDLTTFIPNILWHPKDGGPYIPFGLSIVKDPDTGRRNMAIYRIQIKGPTRLGMKLQPPHHGGVAQAKAAARGERLEIAIAIGGDPALHIASQALVPYGVDEIALAGALRGRPIPLVRCQSVDLEVPAFAEIVLEGVVLTELTETEGPFGEFQGYYSGAAPRQVVEIRRITHRHAPLYLATYEGRPIGNTHILQAAARDPLYFKQIQDTVCPTVRDVCVTYGGNACYHVVVSIRQQAAGQAKNVALELLKDSRVKHVVVVDHDVDIRNPIEVEWAIATRFQADRDLLILPGMASQHLDPSQPAHPSGLGCKLAVDATVPFGQRFDVIEFPPEVERLVAERWERYGFPRRG